MAEVRSPSSSGGTPKIAVVGLGATGLAVATALQAVKGRNIVLGHDRDGERVREARRLGAIDDAKWNLVDAVCEADLILLAEPPGQTIATIEAIGGHVRPGSLVVGLGHPMVPALEAAQRALPSGVHYVAAAPVVPSDSEPGAAATVSGAEVCLAPMPGASEGALEVLVGLITAIGARPYFIDAWEHDALAAAIEGLPAVLARALVAVVASSPSVRDLRRLAPTRRSIEMGGLDESEAALEGVLLARGDLVPWLDQLIAALARWRDALADPGGAGLDAVVAEADAARQAWQAAAEDADGGGTEAEMDEVNPLRDFLLGRRLGRGHPPDSE